MPPGKRPANPLSNGNTATICLFTSVLGGCTVDHNSYLCWFCRSWATKTGGWFFGVWARNLAGEIEIGFLKAIGIASLTGNLGTLAGSYRDLWRSRAAYAGTTLRSRGNITGSFVSRRRALRRRAFGTPHRPPSGACCFRTISRTQRGPLALLASPSLRASRNPHRASPARSRGVFSELPGEGVQVQTDGRTTRR